MRRLCLAWVLIAAVVFGQYPQPYPQGQSYPQRQPYPPVQQYPAPQGYPQSQGYPQNQEYPPTGYPPYTAQNQRPSDPADRQHGAVRLSIVQGDVNVVRGDTGEPVAAVVNAPLMTQDHLQTSNGSRAEVELDAGNVVRLAPNTDVGLAQAEEQHFVFQLGTGTVVLRVLQKTNAQVEIDTPLMGVRPVSEGDYRITVQPDGTIQVTARAGQAQILASNRSEDLAAGQSLLVRGNPNSPEFQSIYPPARDQFDDWSAHRDQDMLASQSYQYVSPEIAGAQDLDQYGSWVPSEYGQVWQPQAPPDWSPYSDGEWVSEPYYGYTWVDAAPWGWAPFHYGRWFWNGGRGWCWWPGAIRASYFWSPAVVGFFGWGGFGVGFFGGLGWAPLAPYEVYHPWWGRWAGSGGYGVYRGAPVTRVYRNAAFRGGAMTASFSNFGGPHGRFVPASSAQLMSATIYHGQIPVAVTRTSAQYSNRPAFSNPALAGVRSRQFFNGAQQFRSGFTPAPAWTYAPRSNGTYTPPEQSRGSSGWTRFGDPRSPAGMSRSFIGGSESSGWHSFGQPSPSTAYGNSYQPRAYQNYAPPRQQFSAPRPPVTPHYSAPQYSAPRQSTPYYRPPQPRGGGGNTSHGGGGNGSGSGGSHTGGGGHGGRR
ncbi:MAG: FecR domain-containing protein [Acidobacteriaceae bacterium]|nr:FecR domain-containing protein [Acidobacteriaceae bacterium]